jgi:gluconokinase
MDNYVIGVDIGTGSTKAVAVTSFGATFAAHAATYPTKHSPAGFAEQDADTVCNAFFQCIKSVINFVGHPPEAVVFSSAMHSIMPVNNAGTPMAPLMIWSDNRSATIATRIRNSSMAELLYEQNGTPLHAMSPLFKLLWMKENSAHLFTNASKFICIKEYIWFRLFGVFEIDSSIASATGMMRIEDCRWDQNALHLLDLSENKLSTIVNTSFTRSNAQLDACAKLGVTSKTRFIIGASDGCLANLGSFAVDEGVAALTIGTSGAIRVASSRPITDFQTMMFNYRLDESTFICGGPVNNGGIALNWYVENFLGRTLQTKNDYDAVLNDLYETKPGADGLMFLPYLFGERAPLWDSNATGMFYGIKGIHGQKHFIRAVIEGISMSLYDVGENLSRAGVIFERIHVSGGFARSSAWLKIIANMFNKKICLLQTDDASALGAAYLGMKATGMINHYREIPQQMQEVQPDDSIHNIYRERLGKFRDIYHRLI